MDSDKKRLRKDEEMEHGEDDGENEEDDDEGEEMDDEEFVDETMQLDFEGRKPENLHYNGICTLLHQVFLKLHVDVSNLTDWIIKHNNVGAVLQQLEPSDDEGDDDDADSDGGTVMSITSVVDLTTKQDADFAQQLKTVLLERCKSAAPKLSQQFEELLSGAANRTGLLINERMIGLPPHVAVLESLWKDIEKAKTSEQEYNFTHFLVFSKTLQMITKKKKKNAKEAVTKHFMNVEEELLHKNSVLSFEFSVKDQCDEALSGVWDDDDGDSYEPFRTVSVVSADQIPTIMSQMATWISSNN